ncbi:MAG: PKD domain-containing protein [Spirosomataceae bacterium]
MKTSNYLSFIFLAGTIFACKEKEPQPDWASPWVGIYSTQVYDKDTNPYRISPQLYSATNYEEYWIYCTAIVEKVDNTTLRMSIVVKPEKQTYTPIFRIPLPVVKYTFNNVKAINENTLVIDEVVKDSQGNTIMKLDTIVTYYYRGVDTYKLFRFKQLGGLGASGTIYFEKTYNDTNMRPLFSMHKPGIAVPFVNKWYYWAMVDGVSYQWDFGDGKTSTQEDNYYEYTKNGNYTVKFSVTDKMGKTYTTQELVQVDNLPE